MFSLELLLILPIVWVLFCGLIELSLLLMSMQRVQAASSAACRIGTLPCENAVAQQEAMLDAAARALGTAGMVANCTLRSDVGQYAGDPVVVEVSVPMTSAAPDLLRVIGFSLQNRRLVAQTQMCKQ